MPAHISLTCRLLLDPQPNSGDWNMATDELLLANALAKGETAVRVYRWKEPTVSLGYFQKIDGIPTQLRNANLPIVRRLSGGGAILHHHELTYSLAVPADHRAARDPYALYERVHSVIIGLLSRNGITAYMAGNLNSSTGNSTQDDPFLCFLRRSSFDVVLSGGKILGSAQRRRRGAVLQHGSLILQSSPFTPEVPGLVDLVDDDGHASGDCFLKTVDTFSSLLIHKLGELFANEAIDDRLTPDEHRVLSEKTAAAGKMHSSAIRLSPQARSGGDETL